MDKESVISGKPLILAQKSNFLRHGGESVIEHASDMETQRLKELFNVLNDGIVVMDKHRVIVFVNPAATQMTGWSLGDVIPYCLYCQQRTVAEGEERCFLASQPTQSYFESEMPTKRGAPIPVGMSRTFLSSGTHSSSRDMVIIIRDVTVERQAKELELRSQINHHTLVVQEEERKRLSQELHDGISQTLYGINLRLEHWMNQHPAEGEELHEVYRQVQRCATEVRQMSRTLYPAVLYDLGLTAAIRTLAEQMSAPTRKVSVNIQQNWVQDELNPSVVHVYRIVQEALHNAVHHGKATSIEVSFVCGQDCTLRITDNGLGFDLNSLASTPGYGLRNMRERASALQGRLNIWSAPLQGTTIEVAFSAEASLLQKRGEQHV